MAIDQMNLEKDHLKQVKSILTGYASVDKPWMNIYQKIDPHNIDINMSIYQMLEKYSQDNLNSTAMWIPGKDLENGLKIKYKTYLEECRKLAKSFDGIGAKKEEIIPIILPNIPESRCSIYGLNYLGGVSYPIIPSLPSKELEKILITNSIDKVVIFSGFYEKYKEVFQNCGVKCVIITDGTGLIPNYLKKVANTTAKLKGEPVPFKDYNIPYRSNIITWDEFLKAGKKRKVEEPFYKANSTAAIIGTSGTTGVPKGAIFTNENINAQAFQHFLADIDCEKGDKILDILIQSISYGFSVMHYEGILGTEAVMIPNLVTDKITEVIDKIKPVQFTGGPVHFIYMSRSDLFNQGKLEPMKNAISGGAKLPADVEKKLNKDQIYVKQGYGTTECLGGATGPKGEYKFGSIGTPLPLTNMGIFKPGTDEELKYNEIGEICISAPTVMQGYLNNKEETKKSLITHHDGKVWLHTKDLGYCDETGHFYFAERISDTFMRCGFNVHPNKIAEFLNKQPYVAESHVLGVPHNSEQEVPVAFVVLKPEYVGQEEKIKEILKDICYNNLDEMSIPYEWIFTNAIPRNIGGKIVNRQLIADYHLDYSNVKSNGISLQRKK